jgi:hypothetical protein
MEAMGIDRVIAVDLHCGQIQGFFGPRVPVDNLDGGIVGLDYFGCKDLHNPVIVSPDAGGVYRAKKFKEGLEQKYDMQDLGLAMTVKQRARAGSVDQMDLVGDVQDCDRTTIHDRLRILFANDDLCSECKTVAIRKEKSIHVANEQTSVLSPDASVEELLDPSVTCDCEIQRQMWSNQQPMVGRHLWNPIWPHPEDSIATWNIKLL